MRIMADKQKEPSPATGEFHRIAQYFRPLAKGAPGAFNLGDDAAVFAVPPGRELVVTLDTIVEGVHFIGDEAADMLARKAMRVNLSDLAAKGAEPFGYLLACHWSERCGWPERKAFVEGLARDQAEFGVALLGGDTVSTPGPASFSITLMGWAAKGRIVGRAGAQPGDLVFVTGTVGDGWLGLRAARELLTLEPERLSALVEHYRRPMPRTVFAHAILEHASAALDVSDGLIADLGHLGAPAEWGWTCTWKACRCRWRPRPGSTGGPMRSRPCRSWRPAATTMRLPLPPGPATNRPCGARPNDCICA